MGVVAPDRIMQVTIRLSSEQVCERVIRVAHERGIASAMAYSGPENGGRSIFVMLMDEPDRIEDFLPELRGISPDSEISLSEERLAHLSPKDFLRGGAQRPRPFRTNVENIAFVFFGGAIGGTLRVLLDAGAGYVTPVYAAFPWGTFAVNVIGSFVISVLGALLSERFIGERERMFWMLGFLGSFTTFSSFVLQVDESGDLSPIYGALYAGASIIAGLAAALLGILLTRRFTR